MQIRTKRVDNTLPTDKLTRIAKDKTILSFYHDPPSQELSLDEFERYAFDRLTLLRKIEHYYTRITDHNELNAKIDQAENVSRFNHHILLLSFKRIQHHHLLNSF